MEGLLCVDRELYDSCRDYANRLIQQKLARTEGQPCVGSVGIKELCDKCPYFKVSEFGYMEN